MRISDYPGLALLAWNRGGDDAIDEAEAFALYERNWRYVDEANLGQSERRFLADLVRRFGRGFWMFKRPGYQRVAEVLSALNSDLLTEAECFFGGGTAIALSLGEYRESLDIDFLCSSHAGYRILRNAVSNRDLGSLLREPVKHLREVRIDRDGINGVTFQKKRGRKRSTPTAPACVRDSKTRSS